VDAARPRRGAPAFRQRRARQLGRTREGQDARHAAITTREPQKEETDARPPNNGHSPRPGGQPPATPPGPPQQAGIAALAEEAEAVRAMLREAHGRLGRLVAALKEQRKQSRAVQAAVASLRQLQQLNP
jgi:hypothetical protein